MYDSCRMKPSVSLRAGFGLQWLKCVVIPFRFFLSFFLIEDENMIFILKFLRY